MRRLASPAALSCVQFHRATQRCGWAVFAASLRRPSLRAGSPALLAPRGDFDNSALGTGPQTRRSRRGVPLQPRCAALLGAAEAQHPPPTRTSAGTDGAARDSASGRAPRRLARWCLQGRRRASGEAPLRRRGAQGHGGCASPQGDASSAACPSSEHRQLAQRDAGRARASSALAPGDGCTEPGRKTVPADCLSPGEGQSACKRFGTQGSRRNASTAAAKRSRSPAHGLARWLWGERPIAAPKRRHSPTRGLACSAGCGKGDERHRTAAVA